MNHDAPHILLVEDDPHIRRFVRAALEAEGCRVRDSETMTQGLLEAGEHHPDMVVLDLGLPDGDGKQFVQDLRTWSSMPVLVLSARDAEVDKIAVLDAGADDYLTKPFAVGELQARVRAMLRRARRSSDVEQPHLQFAQVDVDLIRRQVTRQGEAVHLTPIEYRLLCVLMANAGKVMTHRHLLRDVWGPAFVDSSHYLRIYVGHLRQKLEHDPTQPQHFLTEVGVGYRFVLTPSSAR